MPLPLSTGKGGKAQACLESGVLTISTLTEIDDNRCAKCGACSVVCPIYRVTGRESASPRGRIHLLKKLDATSGSKSLAEIISQCLLCGACVDACPRGVDIPAKIVQARCDLPHIGGDHPYLRLLTRKTIASPALLAGATLALSALGKGLLSHLPPESGLRLRLGIADSGHQTQQMPAVQNPPPPAAKAKKKDSPAYFTGCYASHLAPEIVQATTVIVAQLGSELIQPRKQTCCGLAALSAGQFAEARKLAQKNITAFADTTGPIITSCASCHAHLSDYPRLFPPDDPWHKQAQTFSDRLRPFSAQVTSELSGQPLVSGPAPKAGLRVFYHVPCHSRFNGRSPTATLQLLEMLPGITLVSSPGGPRCCGHGGLFNLAHPQLSEKIGATAAAPIGDLDVDLIITDCTGCLLQWRRLTQILKIKARVTHLGIFLHEQINLP